MTYIGFVYKTIGLFANLNPNFLRYLKVDLRFWLKIVVNV